MVVLSRAVVTSLLLCPFADAFVIAPLSLKHRIATTPTLLKSSNLLYNGPSNSTTTSAPLFETFDINDEASLWHQKQGLDAFNNNNGLDAFKNNNVLTDEAKTEQDAIWKARLLLVGAAALYGTNFSLVKILGDTMPVSVSSALRFGLAALATMPWLLKQEEDEEAARGATLAGLEVGLWNSVGYIAQAVGLATTDASKVCEARVCVYYIVFLVYISHGSPNLCSCYLLQSAFICSLAVVVVPLLDFMFGKKLQPKEIAGVVLAVVGVAVLELGGSSELALSQGDLLSLVQPLAFGMGFWRMEKGMKKYPQHANRSTAAQLLAVFLASTAYGAAVGIPDVGVIMGWLHDPNILLALFWTGCITTALTVYMETLALKTLSAAETTLIFSTEPLWGAACASVVMGEQLGFETLAGGALILGGCLFSNLGVEGIFGKDNVEKIQNLFVPLASLGVATQQALAIDELIVETDSMDVIEEVIKNASDSM